MANLINIKQLSDKIGFARRTLYEWVSKNKIPHYRTHGNLRFDEEKINYWLSRKEL
jgi:excisionase family DNA binding protein